MPRKLKQVKPKMVDSDIGPPKWADKELLGFYCSAGTGSEQALIECIAIRESIGQQLGGYHCANVRMILYQNHSWEQYYSAARWEGIKRLLVKYSTLLERMCKASSSSHAWSQVYLTS